MKQIYSSVAFQDGQGTALTSGSIIFSLPNGVYELASGGGQVVGRSFIINFDATGKIPLSAMVMMIATDELNPQTAYNVTICAQANGDQPVGSANWLISGAGPIDLSLMTPQISSPAFAAPVMLNPANAGLQTIAGALSALNTASGNLAMKYGAADKCLFVSSTGSDSNDGLSAGSAKATLQAAINALPASGGTIYLLGGTYVQNTALTLKSNVNIIGMGSAQVDSVTGPTTITTTLGSGELFYFNGVNDCLLSDFSIKNIGSAGANSAIRLTAAQRNTFQRLYIAGPFLNQVQLDSSAGAAASCIWNAFFNIHTTGTAPNGVGLLLDSKDANAKTINGNFFYNFRATGGSSGFGIKFTNSGVHNQIINENVFFASEATASGGTALQVDQGSTRGAVFIDLDAEGSNFGLVKQTANTLTFLGGNISANLTTNVTDAQPAFTQMFGTNVGGIVQQLGITPAGGLNIDGIGLNTAPVHNAITGNSSPITSCDLTTASNGNKVSLLNVQNNLSAVVGTAADATLFTFAIPANVVAVGKAVRIRFWVGHGTGTAGVNYKFKIGSTTISNYGSPSANGTQQGEIILYNQGGGLCTKIDSVLVTGTPTLQGAPGYGTGNTGDFSAGFSVSLTGSFPNTDQVTPQFWTVELMQ